MSSLNGDEQALETEEEFEEVSDRSSDEEESLFPSGDESEDLDTLEMESCSLIEKLEMKIKNGENVSTADIASLMILHHKQVKLGLKQLNGKLDELYQKIDQHLNSYLKERDYENNFPLNAGNIVEFDALLADVTKGKQFVSFVENALRNHIRKLPESTIYQTMETIVDESVFNMYEWEKTKDDVKEQFASTNIATHLKIAIQNVLYSKMIPVAGEKCARMALHQWFRRRNQRRLRERKNVTAQENDNN